MKNPITSRVQKGTVNAGQTRKSEASEFVSPGKETIHNMGMKRTVGGIICVLKNY